MKASAFVAVLLGLAVTHTAYAQDAEIPYVARAFNPAHRDLPRSAGIAAQLANEDYVEALARVVYYWGYPAVDMFGRTSMWELMKDGPGLMFGVGPGAPVNVSGCIADYLPPAQRIVVPPLTAPPSSISASSRSSSRRRRMCLKAIIG